MPLEKLQPARQAHSSRLPSVPSGRGVQDQVCSSARLFSNVDLMETSSLESTSTLDDQLLAIRMKMDRSMDDISSKGEVSLSSVPASMVESMVVARLP